MSRIGKQPIQIPDNVDVNVQDSNVHVKGSKGEMSFEISSVINLKKEDNMLIVERVDDTKEAKSFHGLTRTVIDNMIVGVTKGFEKKMEVIGVGYKAEAQGKTLKLALGFSHPINYPIPEGITISVEKEKNDIITVQGIDKVLVGQVAADIRKYRPPEPYKGKGIRYVGEHVRRKEGKKVAA